VTFNYGAAGAGWTPIVGRWNGGALQLAAGGEDTTTTDASSALTSSELNPIVSAAIGQLTSELDLDAAAVAKLTSTHFIISNLSSGTLGMTDGNTIYLDASAAGYGWFVDSTPLTNEEFTPSADGKELTAITAAAVDKIDLLTVVEHELVHILGYADVDAAADSLMSETLGVGVRRDAVDAALTAC
jgi:hypothetical protein